MSADLYHLAERAGVQTRYHALTGETVTASDRALRAALHALGIAAADDVAVAASLATIGGSHLGGMEAPDGPRCYMPTWLREGRCWGVACQLYGLRSARNWGIGDFEDLGRLAELVASAGADFVGVNPLHALFMADTGIFSPFSPSSRRF